MSYSRQCYRSLNAVSDRADEVSALSKIVHEFKGTALSQTDLML
jgi:hypothetical protein